MTTKTISNPAGVWGMTADTNDQEIITVVNGSGGTLLPGDLVIVDGVAGVSVTTTTTANSKGVRGVVVPSTAGTGTVASTETVASGATCKVCVAGTARINIGAATVAALDVLATSTTAKVAAVNNAAGVGAGIAIALEADSAKDANNTIRALIGKM